MFAARLKHYADFYTWSHALDDGVIAHQDGAVSRLIEWDGVDGELATQAERDRMWERFNTLLNAVPLGYCAEFHWWREWDDGLAQGYLKQGERMVRGGEFARAVRAEQAAHLARYGIANEVGLVLVKLPAVRFRWGAKRALINQAKDAELLNDQVARLLPSLPGGRVAEAGRYLKRIQQSFDRRRFTRGYPAAHDPRFLISENLLAEAPEDEGGIITLGESTSKVLLVYQYPDAMPSWFLGLSRFSIAMHVAQIVLPVDTRAAMRRSERESQLAEGTLSARGAETQGVRIRDLADFREYVAQNTLRVFHNAYVIHLHGSLAEITEHARLIADWIETQGGQVHDARAIQLPFFRAAQPGQGYRSPYFRPDHRLQIANMLPAQVYRSGDPQPESLRLASSGQLVGFNFTSQSVAHAFTIAMTGGGKGVDKVATIAETYPLGIDWYIAEIGQSYRWVVEAFGGTYSRIDPTESVINPLPPYSVANSAAQVSAERSLYPLDALMAGQTINALAFLLTDGRTTLTVHERSAGQAALQFLYARAQATPAAKPALSAPSLPQYLRALNEDLFATEEQALCAKSMAANLESFLGTTEGRIFTRDDNLVLSEGITGVDLRDVDRANPQLLKFYLVFLALKFSHLAFARRTPARVLLDEMHKFVAIAPEVIGRLISELARMGRKDAAAIDIVTQGISEIDCIEKEVLNSMRLRSLLYRPDEHEDIARRIDMPPGALSIWRSWKDPTEFAWRPAMRSVGAEYFNLHLSFPGMILDLASTTDRDLTLKEEIGKSTHDPFERLQRLREARSAMNRTRPNQLAIPA